MTTSQSLMMSKWRGRLRKNPRKRARPAQHGVLLLMKLKLVLTEAWSLVEHQQGQLPPCRRPRLGAVVEAQGVPDRTPPHPLGLLALWIRRVPRLQQPAALQMLSVVPRSL